MRRYSFNAILGMIGEWCVQDFPAPNALVNLRKEEGEVHLQQMFLQHSGQFDLEAVCPDNLLFAMRIVHYLRRPPLLRAPPA